MTRKIDKVETYFKKLVKNAGGEIIEANLSSYYNINGHVIRISNHIGKTSSGNMSVIIPNNNKEHGQYVIHVHATGEITVLDYPKVKELLRSFIYIGSVFNSIVQDEFTFERDREIVSVQKELDELRQFKEKQKEIIEKGEKDMKNYILGVPVSIFTSGQLNCIRSTVANVVRKSIAGKKK
jgi:hypothetical protein